MAIGLLHQIVGIAIGLGLGPVISGSAAAPLLDLWHAGVIGQAEQDPLRIAIVWFLMFGFLLILLGMVLHRLERSGGKLSRGLAWGLGGLCALGVLVMPTSGFWLGFVPTVQIWRRAADHPPGRQ